MDLLPPPTEAPAGGPSPGTPRRGLRRGVGFRSLKLVSVAMDEPLPADPVGAAYGRLANGLTYYVRSNPKPRMRPRSRSPSRSGQYSPPLLACCLPIRLSASRVCFLADVDAPPRVRRSVVEEEHERGVAHIVEHLAFSATSRYTNHDIVKFLESIGAEFGACQNALTSSDETIYELLVPVDKPGLLSQAISVLAEFSSEVRVSAEDLEKERGAVLEEYRGGRNASGRMQDSHWALLFQGSKYAERLPIGTEKVIRTVPHETVKHFYQKWYHLSNMAVFAVGDFPDTQRLFKISRRNDPPYFSCSSAADALVHPVKAYIMTSSCREKGTVVALESMLLEVARVRLHGFSDREISIVRALMMSEIESAYLERDQMQSTSLRDEFLQHFLREEPVVGIEYEAQLQKTLLPHISSAKVAKFAENFSTSSSCVIKIVEPRAHASLEDLKAIVLKVNSLEKEKSIPPWDEEQIPEEIVAQTPEPGYSRLFTCPALSSLSKLPSCHD
ncbi:hypothetical protein PR202_gb05820 [Eleusine coracana subsp. coracana]|uniref:Uncharacterized protein n=1 Tax=Eleusine coracana subsp. coracana TaxID=191504 RepID=A0AAV5E808_ELECO|nr:hypothetical protein PR202_gb05820 [Eleusine coracana subsp. coracana]